jgi:lysozyme
MNRDRLKKQLETDEGKRAKMYLDTVGKWTAGVGRNLSDRAFSEDEIQLMLSNDIDLAAKDVRHLVPGFGRLDDVRQEVLVNMAVNLGFARLSGFKRFLAAVGASEFAEASLEMLDSKWAKQVGDRAQRLSKAMRTGSWS